MKNITLHNGDSGSPSHPLSDSMPSDSNSGMPYRDPFQHYQQRRQYAIERLICRFAVQLQHGCGSLACKTPTCHSYKSRSLPQPSRKLTSISARAMAVLLVASDQVEECLCPYLSTSQLTTSYAEIPEKIDRKSVIQRLFSTQALENIQMTARHLTNGGSNGIGPFQEIIDSQETGLSRYQLPPSVAVYEHNSYAPDQVSESLGCLTCTEMTSLRKTLALSSHGRSDSYLNDWTYDNGKRSPLHPSTNRISSQLSDFKSLSGSLLDHPLDIYSEPFQHDLPTTWIDQAFRGWSTVDQALIFDSIWLALEPLFESPFVLPDQYPDHFVSLPPSKGFLPTVHVVMCALHALTASVPRAPEETWQVILSTVVNGRAHGKQRNRPSNSYSSPWVHILDSLEFEPGLRMAKRLVRAIAARTCLEETLLICGVNDQMTDATFKAWKFPKADKIRASIITELIEEERKVREAKFGDSTRDEARHSKALSGTTSRVWLEWLRKCFLKEWDGSYRISRWGVAGAALEMVEQMCKSLTHLSLPKLTTKL